MVGDRSVVEKILLPTENGTDITTVTQQEAGCSPGVQYWPGPRVHNTTRILHLLGWEVSLLIGPDKTFTKMGSVLANRARYYIYQDGNCSVRLVLAIRFFFLLLWRGMPIYMSLPLPSASIFQKLSRCLEMVFVQLE